MFLLFLAIQDERKIPMKINGGKRKRPKCKKGHEDRKKLKLSEMRVCLIGQKCNILDNK